MDAPGGRWAEAREAAVRTGEVRTFGDATARRHDSTPEPGPVAAAAGAHGRGGLRPAGRGRDRRRGRGRRGHPARAARPRDGPGLSPRSRAGSGIDLAWPGRRRVTAGDSIGSRGRGPVGRGRLERQPRGRGPRRATKTVAHASGSRWPSGRRAAAHIVVPSAAIGRGRPLAPRPRCAGAGDAEPRTDARLHLVTVAPTPGVVLLAAPGRLGQPVSLSQRSATSPSSRCGGTSELDARPLALDERPSRRVGPERVRQAARSADLLILKGDAGSDRGGSERPGHLALAQRETGAAPVAGDWYLSGRRRLARSPGRSWGSRWTPSPRPPSSPRRRRSRRLDRTHRAARPARGGPTRP